MDEQGAEDVPVVYLHEIKRQYMQGERQLTILDGAKLALWAGQSVALLADEPTGNLDPGTADHVFHALMQLVKATRVAMLIATHNMELAGRMDRRVSIVGGKVVELD